MIESLPLELRIKTINYLGDLRLEYLKRFYDQRSIAELYLGGEICIHVHRKEKKWQCDTYCSPTQQVARWPNNGQIFMFVGVGNIPQNLRPINTFVRLQSLNQCLVFMRDSFEVSFSPPIEAGWRIFDRKSCALLDASRIEKSHFIDEVIKGGSKIVDRFSNENTEDWRYCGDAWTEQGNGLWFPETVISSSQVHQVLLCPTYSRVGIVKGWLDAIGLSHGEETSDTKSPEGARDSDSNPQGLLRDSKKSLRTRRSPEGRRTGIKRQLDEGLAQTETVHSPGSSTSKHTRSGNPEDA